MNSINPTTTAAWERLSILAEKYKELQIISLFDKRERFERYSIQLDDMLVDFSKNRVNDEIIDALRDLAEETKLHQAIE